LKILHVIPAYYPATYWGGPIFSVYALNNALAQLPDVFLKVLTTDAAGPRVSERLEPSDMVRLYPNQEVIMTRRLVGACVSVELLRELPRLIRWADVVHLTSTYSFPVIPTLAICRILNKPLVWSPRGAIQDAHEWKGAKHRRPKKLWELFCNMLIRSDSVLMHTTSEREQNATQARIPKALAMIVPNGVDVPSVTPEREWLPNGQLRLMYLGRLSPKKGIENILLAINQLHDPSVSLTIYGTGEVGYVAHLKELTAHLGHFENTINFAGHVNGEAKSAAFHVADACIVASYTENYCMVVAEALAYGVPVIVSHGAPWAEIEKKRCGLWVDNSPESLAQAITRIRTMGLQKMGELGREWMQMEFNWEVIAKSMHKIYGDVI